jgi:hypothetical protein
LENDSFPGGKKLSNFTLKNRLKMQVTGRCATQPGVLQHSFPELEGYYWFDIGSKRDF